MKILILCLSLILAGCGQGQSTAAVQELTQKCIDQGGKPLVNKYTNEEVSSVWCEIHGAQFRQGNY